MQRRITMWGLAFGCGWLVLGVLILYMIARFHDGIANLQWLCLLWMLLLPVVAGFLSGWRHTQNGFWAGGCAFPGFLLAMAIIWWWLWPDLWDFRLWLLYTCYTMFVAMLLGGMGSGFKLAHNKLHPPQSQSPPTEEEDIPAA